MRPRFAHHRPATRAHVRATNMGERFDGIFRERRSRCSSRPARPVRRTPRSPTSSRSWPSGRPPAPRALARVEGKADDGSAGREFLCVTQRGAVPDGVGMVQPPRRGPGGRLVRGLRAGHRGQPRRGRAMREVASTSPASFPKPDRRDRPRRGRGRHMGCGDACPIFPASVRGHGRSTDPAGQGIDDVRPIRDSSGRSRACTARRPRRAVGQPSPR